MARHNLWPTPTRNDYQNAGWQRAHGKQYFTLPGAAGATKHLPPTMDTDRERRWPTPNARDWKSASAVQGSRHDLNLNSAVHVEPEVEQPKGQLNPGWVEWLMGWPPGWSDPTRGCAASFVDWQRHQHDWFDEDPALDGLYRTAVSVENRPARLKAIGNGQVPACVVLAWAVLSNDWRQS